MDSRCGGFVSQPAAQHTTAGALALGDKALEGDYFMVIRSTLCSKTTAATREFESFSVLSGGVGKTHPPCLTGGEGKHSETLREHLYCTTGHTKGAAVAAAGIGESGWGRGAKRCHTLFTAGTR